MPVTYNNGVPATQGEVSPKSKAAAIFLALIPFVAWAGAHDFYLGYTKRGFLHLGLFLSPILLTVFTFGLLSALSAIIAFCVIVWWGIDAILMIAGAGPYKTDGMGRPLV